MTIETEQYFRLLNEETKEQTYELKFNNVDSNRIVPIEVTGWVIRGLHRWVKSYNEKIIPNMGDDPRAEELKSYIRNLDYIASGLAPENKTTNGESFVRASNSFLRPNKVLTHNQALFTLLGLNVVELDYSLAELPTLNGTCPIGKNLLLENNLWSTPQNFELKSCAYFDKVTITSENLIKFATEDNNFFSDNWKKNELFKDAKALVPLSSAKTRPSTDYKRILVNELYEECVALSEAKNWTKESRANWIATEMRKRPEIESKFELEEINIYRNYLKGK